MLNSDNQGFVHPFLDLFEDTGSAEVGKLSADGEHVVGGKLILKLGKQGVG